MINIDIDNETAEIIHLAAELLAKARDNYARPVEARALARQAETLLENLDVSVMRLASPV